MDHTLSRGPFFTRDRGFYRTYFSMFAVVALQNLIAYSVNMADNIMLGSYSQDALSGAATVNQLFFLIQAYANAIGAALVVLAAQYWGQHRVSPIRVLTGIALRLGTVSGAVILAVCILFPKPILGLFTTSEAIVEQGTAYLNIVQWSFFLFILTTILISALRSVGTVKISFWISLVSLVLNVAINYTLIFGRFGFPELGICGAAVGTLISRAAELAVALLYLVWGEKKLELHPRELLSTDRALLRDYFRVLLPVALSNVLWSMSVPVQTAVLGHLSDDAIAANSVATTFYQYLKVVVLAMSSTAAVLIGNTVGEGNIERVRSESRTLSIIDLGMGLLLGMLLLLLRTPLLRMYSLTQDAITLASRLIALLSLIMVGMSYQMPIVGGIFQGGGDVQFSMRLNLISLWCISIPLALAAAFWWHWPAETVVLLLQSDQIFKALPAAIRLYRYKWIKKLTQA